jgi:DNA-binding transcriptional LysR family regulator
VLPHYLVESHLERSELVRIHVPKRSPSNTLYLATRASRRHHASIAEVHDTLMAAAADW